jgi:hypothetical protein
MTTSPNAEESRILTSRSMNSHMESFTSTVRASALIALSISGIIPSCGGGKFPDRIMLDAVTDGSSGAFNGEDDVRPRSAS